MGSEAAGGGEQGGGQTSGVANKAVGVGGVGASVLGGGRPVGVRCKFKSGGTERPPPPRAEVYRGRRVPLLVTFLAPSGGSHVHGQGIEQIF